MILGNCQNITVPINVTSRGHLVQLPVESAHRSVIGPNQSIKVPIVTKALSSSRDFLFEPKCKLSFGQSGGISTLIVDVFLSPSVSYQLLPIEADFSDLLHVLGDT